MSDAAQPTIGNYYYVKSGVSVKLEAITTDGKFVVEPLHEGETYEMQCYGGPPIEHTVGYIHYGPLEIVDCIFSEPPIRDLARSAA